jgi:hypothetical protein
MIPKAISIMTRQYLPKPAKRYQVGAIVTLSVIERDPPGGPARP